MFYIEKNSDSRQKIDKVLSDFKSLASHREQMNALGVKVLAVDGSLDPTYTCDAFVFGAQGLNLPWYNVALRYQIMLNGDTLLKYHGFKETDSPTLYDVVAYRQTNPLVSPHSGRLIYTDSQRVLHYGIMGPDGKVVSKWGVGLVYSHAKDMVPQSFGDSITVYTPETNVIGRLLRHLRAKPKVDSFKEFERQRELHFLAEHPEQVEAYLEYKSQIK